MIKINGEFFDFTQIPLCQFLEEHHYCSGRIAVERNGWIVPKAQYAETVLQDGEAMGTAIAAVCLNMAAGNDALADTEYVFDETGVAVRIPYAPYEG